MKLNHIFITCFIIFFTACNAQVKSDFKSNSNVIEDLKSEYLQSDLIIGLCTLKYTSNYKRDSILSDKETFISITKLYFEYADLDSIKKEIFIRQLFENNNSSTMKEKLFLFIENYKIVTNLIFANIDDDNENAQKEFETKASLFNGTSKIYRLYVLKNQDLASLTSYSGIALNIHLAYYLTCIDAKERAKVIKQLL